VNVPLIHYACRAYCIRDQETYLSLTNDKNDKDLCSFKKDSYF
jgi:hypothetical protein